MQRRISFQDQMIASFEGHEMRGTNASSEYTSFLKWHDRVIATMQYERRYSNAGKETSHVDVVHCLAHPHSVLWGRRPPL